MMGAKEGNAAQGCWREWNREGFIPGPEETEEALAQRVAFCRRLSDRFDRGEEEALPFELEAKASPTLLEEALPLTEALYGIRPSWVPLFFSDRQLAPWHGGCTWIFQSDARGPTAAFLQLRTRFLVPGRRRFYQRGELIAHELAHVGRMLYCEPKFEELFAYRSSPFFWRRWLGAVVQSTRESLFFVSFLGLIAVVNGALLLFNAPLSPLWLEGGLLLGVFLALARLFFRHRTLNACAAKLRTLYPHAPVSQHLLYRLRDAEIQRFAASSPEEIGRFIERAAQHSFRWRFLKALYPPTHPP